MTPRSVSAVSGLSGVSIDTSGRLPEGEKAILIAAAQYPDGLTREQASILTGYKRSTRDAYIQRLQLKGYLQPGGGIVVATDAGVAALGSDYQPLPVGEELQRYWLDRLPQGEKAILEVAIYHYPKAVAREEIDNVTGFKRSTRDAYIQRLQARQLLAKGGGAVTATAVLFEG
jgi:Fic family protein